MTNNETKPLVAEALSKIFKIIMNNHVYKFKGVTQVRRGKECIGGQKDSQ